MASLAEREAGGSRWLALTAVAVAAAGAFLSYELGRYQAGYSLLDDRRRTARLERELAARAETIEALERERAILETSRRIDRETYARVEQALERLQARLQAREEELAFYRGIVAPEDGVAGLRIERLELEPANGERRVQLKLVLVQAIAHSERVRGRAEIRVSGRLAGEPAELGLDALAHADPGPLAYEFRYFQAFERELALPAGFEPDTVTVRIEPEAPAGEPVVQTFGWQDAGG